MIFRSKQLPLMRGLRFPKGGKCLGGGRETHNILFFVPLEWLARGLTPGTSVFLGKAFLHFGDRCKWKGSSRMKECKGIAALLGWALLRILFIGSNSRSPLRCVWCICLANNIPRFRSQIHSWFAAVIVLSIFSLSLSLFLPPFISLLLSLAEFYLAQLRSGNPFATPFRNSFGSWKPNDSGENVPWKILEVHVLPPGWMYFEGWFDVREGRNAHVWYGYLCCEYKLYFLSWTLVYVLFRKFFYRFSKRLSKENRRNNNSRRILN